MCIRDRLTTWVEVQARYMTVWVMTPAGIPVPTQVPYEYRIFHTLSLIHISVVAASPQEAFYAPKKSLPLRETEGMV